MIQSILIANRGEIASRIIRTCKKMGIRTVAVYAEPDKYLPFVAAADEAIALGGNTAKESYLVVDKIIAAAKQSTVQAIHPGFGFLSENADFARHCTQEGFIFIGPNPTAIEQMGLKSTAKQIMQAHHVPTIPGYQGDDQSIETLCQKADEVGYPLLIKAVAGGGGKGMRIAYQSKEVKTAIKAAQQEAQNSFGNADLILERYFSNARHIEFQIFGDQQGNIIHLLERECSIQRRYQKIIEESPSSALDDDLRKKMGEAAVLAAKAIQYDNAGTVEFILTPEKEFFFLEVNTRLQVEHPVTEMITGLDLVEWQILVAAGYPLPLTQDALQANGYAVECRLYAEDASNNFFPATGTILHWEAPSIEGVRYESGVKSGTEIGIYYDPMIAKIIAHAPNRVLALQKMRYSLQQLKCLGITTNQSFLTTLLEQEAIIQGAYHTNYLDHHFDFSLLEKKAVQYLPIIASLLYQWHQRQQKRTLIPSLSAGWRNNFYQAQQVNYSIDNNTETVWYTYQNDAFEVTINEETYAASLYAIDKHAMTIVINQQHHKVFICQQENTFYIHHSCYGQLTATVVDRFPTLESSAIAGGYTAPMPSEVLAIQVNIGDVVEVGQPLLTLLSMKMENTITANEGGIIENIFVQEGQAIPKDTLLLSMKDES